MSLAHAGGLGLSEFLIRELFAWTNRSGQSAVVDSVSRVPQWLANSTRRRSTSIFSGLPQVRLLVETYHSLLAQNLHHDRNEEWLQKTFLQVLIFS